MAYNICNGCGGENGNHHTMCQYYGQEPPKIGKVSWAEMEVKGANATQIGGDHYKKGGEEHWDRAWRLKYDCFQYIITKWIERWRDKGGIEDLKKARHAIDKYIEVNTPKPEVTSDPTRVKVTGWEGLTFEGGTAEWNMFRCNTCRTQFKIPLNQPPHCPACPGRSYTNQG